MVNIFELIHIHETGEKAPKVPTAPITPEQTLLILWGSSSARLSLGGGGWYMFCLFACFSQVSSPHKILYSSIALLWRLTVLCVYGAQLRGPSASLTLCHSSGCRWQQGGTFKVASVTCQVLGRDGKAAGPRAWELLVDPQRGLSTRVWGSSCSSQNPQSTKADVSRPF